MEKRNRYWTYEKIVEELQIMLDSLETRVMPTRSEVDKFFGDTRLSNAISKKIGWYNLAGKLDLEIKNSESTMGIMYERKVGKILEDRGYHVVYMTQNHPYDLLVNNIKVDVKSSNLGEYSTGKFYSFRMGKDYATCDVYIMVAIDKCGKEIYYIIPYLEILSNRQISIGYVDSIYDKFIDRWDILDKYIEFVNGNLVNLYER